LGGIAAHELGQPVVVVASRVRIEEKLIARALELRGVAFRYVDDRRLTMCLGQPGPCWGVVLNRGLSATRRLLVSRMCEAWRVPVVNSVQVVQTCDDKVATSLALAGAGLPIPPTTVGLSPEAGLEAIEAVGYPAVVKPVNGSWGRMLAKVNDRDAAEAVLAHRRALPSPLHGIVYAQRFIRTPERDIRAIVVGTRMIGAIYRCRPHWITNTAASAEPRPCPVTPALEELCLRAAGAVGGGAVGIDLLENADGQLLVSEVNSAMEFHGFVQATGADVAGALVEYALELARAP
jgi:[lysine-biosynthesis-protein LysW]--L-2-aminoadipate ligase